MSVIKNLAVAIIVAGGCVVYGVSAEAQTLSVAGILFDFGGCGDGSMCTNDGYICTQ